RLPAFLTPQLAPAFPGDQTASRFNAGERTAAAESARDSVHKTRASPRSDRRASSTSAQTAASPPALRDRSSSPRPTVIPIPSRGIHSPSPLLRSIGHAVHVALARRRTRVLTW